MADGAEGARFWLPSEFFDDCLMEKDNSDKNQTAESDTEFCFPTEFPYDFGTKSDEHLEKPLVMSTSPQSTLAHIEIWPCRSAGVSSNGSPNSLPSPTTPLSGSKNDVVRDLIHIAAGQVSKLKLNGFDVHGPTKHSPLLVPPKILNPSIIHNIYMEKQKQSRYSEAPMYQLRSGTAAAQMGQDAWPIQPNSARILGPSPRAIMFGDSFGGGSTAVKTERSGTGVFLPRRYGNNFCNAYPSDSRKRGYSAASFPNGNVHSMNGFSQSRPHYHPKFNRALIPDYDLLMARRNAIILQHRSTVMNRGECLPHEWTY